MADYDNHIDDLTERYLLHQLNEEQVAEFQARMIHDAQLRRKVRIMRTLQKSLIAAHRSTKKTNRLLQRTGLAVVLVCIFAGLLVYWNNTSRTEATKKKAAPSPPETPAQQPAPQAPLQPKLPAPVAANLVPNPALERYLNDNVRGNNDRLDIASPLPGARFTSKDGKILFRVSGALDAKGEAPGSRMSVFVFSNNKEAYENDRPLWKQKLTFSQENGQYRFQAAARMAVQPGLYYYLIENEESGEVIKVGKFTAE